MLGITVTLLTAAFGFALSRWLHLPSVPLLVLAGVLLQVSGLHPEEAQLQNLLILGLTFLVFAAGTELNPNRIGPELKAAIQVGLAQFLLIGLAGLLVARGLNFGVVSVLYVALALAASSTLVVVRILKQRQQLFEPFGRLVLGVLLVQDVLVIFFLAVLSHTDEGLYGIGLILVFTLGLIGLAGVFLRWLAPVLLLRLSRDEETLLLLVLAILFVFVGLSDALDVPLIVGAFLAGVSLSGFPVNGVIRGQLTSLSHFFMAIFFVALGATLRVPEGTDLLMAALLILLVIVLTPPLVTLLAERAGLSARSGIESGLLLSQTSEFSLVVVLVGVQQGHIGEEVLAVVALVTVTTMMLTPFIATNKMTWRLMRLHPSSRRKTPAKPHSNHLLLIGCGESGKILLDQLKSLGRDILVIDDDPIVVDQLKASGVDAVHGDGADYRLLEACKAREARVVISTMRRTKDHESLLKFVKKKGKVVARVFDEADAEKIRRRGGIPVLYSHAAAQEFLRWFDEEFNPNGGWQTKAAGNRSEPRSNQEGVLPDGC